MNTYNRLWRILGMVSFGLDVLILIVLMGFSSIVLPPFLQVLGRAHPLVLHFPIVCTFLLPFIPRLLSSVGLNRDERHRWMGRYIQIAHFLCAVTVLFGLFLSVESGYSGSEISFHKWGGVILLLVLVLLENLWNFRVHPSGILHGLLFISLVLVVITSHIGAGVTHGQDFLTEPIQRKQTPQVPLEQALVFRDVIHPILEQKCINCHNASRSKGDLVLEDSTSILRGGENGAVLTKGQIGKSPLFQRLILDIDHDDHMPPKGKPQLTQAEISLIGQWINHEQLFDVAYTSLDPADTLAVLIQEHYSTDRREVYDMKPAREEDIRSLNDDYRMLSPVARESPALYARFLSASHYQDEHLTDLTKVAKQVVDLYLGHLPVDDEDMTTVGQFSNLQVLNLNGTEVSDEGLPALYDLADLQKIYLTGTAVTAEGIRKLLEANPVKSLYLWGSEIDSSDLATLRDAFPNRKITGETNPFGHEIIALNAPQISPETSFFESSVTVTFDHPIPQVNIRYTTDGSEPDSLTSPIYDGPMEITEDTQLRVRAFKEGWLSSPSVQRSYYGRNYGPDSVWLATQPNTQYSGNGPATLIDLKAGGNVFEDKSYLGFREEPAVAVFAFREAIPLTKVVASFLVRTPSYIMPPAKVEVSFRNAEGHWESGATIQVAQPTEAVDFSKQSTLVDLGQPRPIKEVKVTVTPVSVLPAWHPGKGDKGWVFLDEVLFQ